MFWRLARDSAFNTFCEHGRDHTVVCCRATGERLVTCLCPIVTAFISLLRFLSPLTGRRLLEASSATSAVACVCIAGRYNYYQRPILVHRIPSYYDNIQLMYATLRLAAVHFYWRITGQPWYGGGDTFLRFLRIITRCLRTFCEWNPIRSPVAVQALWPLVVVTVRPVIGMTLSRKMFRISTQSYRQDLLVMFDECDGQLMTVLTSLHANINTTYGADPISVQMSM